MQRYGNYCNKWPHKMNEFNVMTLVETSHFAKKKKKEKLYFIVIICLVEVDVSYV
jgi:hypothetical protein